MAYYKGYDLSPDYIASAQKRFSHLGDFHVGRIPDCLAQETERYDLILATGLLHHLSDNEVDGMLAKATNLLTENGQFVSIDGVYTPKQSRIARFLLDSDRGDYVREEDAYLRLARKHFGALEHVIAHDWIRIPYSHIAMIGRHS